MRGFYSHLHGLILLLQMANFETVLWSMLLSSPLLHGLYIMDDMGNVDVSEEGDMDLLPVDLLAHIFVSMSSFRDLAQLVINFTSSHHFLCGFFGFVWFTCWSYLLCSVFSALSAFLQFLWLLLAFQHFFHNILIFEIITCYLLKLNVWKI